MIFQQAVRRLKTLVIALLKLFLALPFLIVLLWVSWIQRLFNPSREYLPFLNSLMLAIDVDDCKHLLTTINVLLFFKKKLTLEELRKLGREKLVSKLSAFRKPIIRPSKWFGFPYYKTHNLPSEDDVLNYNLVEISLKDYVIKKKKKHDEMIKRNDSHVEHRDGKNESTDRSERYDAETLVQEIMSEQMANGLDIEFPLWKTILIQNDLEESDKEDYEGDHRYETFMYFMIHHCIGDGYNAIQLFYYLTSFDEQSAPVGSASLNEKLKKKLEAITSRKKSWVNILKLGMTFVEALFSFLISSNDNEDLLFATRENVTNNSKIAWTRNPFALTRLKTIAKKTNCSINTVLYSCVCGALREIMKLHPKRTSYDMELLKGMTEWKEQLKTATWVNTRLQLPPNKIEVLKDRDLEINFGAIFTSLMLHIEDPVEHLKASHQYLSHELSSVMPFIGNILLKFLAIMPLAFLTKDFWLNFSNKVSFSMSNVIGPEYTRYFVGHPVDHILFFTPPTGKIGTFFCFVSTGNTLTFACASATKYSNIDPDVLVQKFEDKIKQLEQALECN